MSLVQALRAADLGSNWVYFYVDDILMIENEMFMKFQEINDRWVWNIRFGLNELLSWAQNASIAVLTFPSSKGSMAWISWGSLRWKL